MTQSTITVSVSAAEILAMYASGTPANGKTILPAPGAGKAIIVKDVVFNYTGKNAAGATSTAYANGGAIGLYMGSVLQTSTLAAAVLVAGGAAQSYTHSIAAAGVITANTKVTISNASAAFITGDGILKVTVTYEVVKV